MRGLLLLAAAVLAWVTWAAPWGAAPPPLAPEASLLVGGSAEMPVALALDAWGAPHIAYVRPGEPLAIWYQPPAGPAELVGAAGDARHGDITLSLALDGAGRPGLAYVDDRSGDLLYAARAGGAWRLERVDAAGRVGYAPSLAFDGAGQPHVSYFDHSNNDVKYGWRETGRWSIETVDASGEPGFFIPAGFTSLALAAPERAGAAAAPRLAYLAFRYKPYDGELRYAERTDA
ncbi:MAG TPA: hypothetical protein VGE07_06945, partial [Herpetosiphonaceae bacterium]